MTRMPDGESHTFLPSFVIVGAMKAGTTSLWTSLRSHPDVFMPDEKELDFFVAEKRWGWGLDWYAQRFAPGASAGARGEASTNYSKYPLFAGVPERMASVIPDARIVYVVRDPIERMRAHYLHAFAEGWERRPMDRAVLEDPQYLDVSRYATQVERYLAVFERSQVLVATAENLRVDHAGTVSRILSFIGVDPAWKPPRVEGAIHATADKVARSRAARFVARIPGSEVFSRLVPPPVRRAWGRHTTIALDREHWPVPDAVRIRVHAALRPEVERLRDFLDHDWDGWGIA